MRAAFPLATPGRWTLTAILATVMGAVFGASVARGQAAGANCPAGKDANATPASSPACPSPAQEPGVQKRFPYPGETSSPESTASPQSSSPVNGSGAASAGDKTTSPETVPVGKRFPYPGEPDAAAAEKGNASSKAQGGLQDTGSSGEASASEAEPSSSSSSSSSSAAGAVPAGEDSAAPVSGADADNDKVPAPRRGRRKLPPVARQTPSEREEEDVRIAAFYQNDGNYSAAYARAHDAVSLAGDDPEAHLALAEAARRLGKLDEAQQHYKRCLELDPVPKLRKVAERSLKEMSGGA